MLDPDLRSHVMITLEANISKDKITFLIKLHEAFYFEGMNIPQYS